MKMQEAAASSDNGMSAQDMCGGVRVYDSQTKRVFVYEKGEVKPVQSALIDRNDSWSPLRNPSVARKIKRATETNGRMNRNAQAAAKSELGMAEMDGPDGCGFIFDAKSGTTVIMRGGKVSAVPSHVKPDPDDRDWTPLDASEAGTVGAARLVREFLAGEEECPIHRKRYFALDFEVIGDNNKRTGEYTTVMTGTSNDPREFMVRAMYSRDEFVGIGGLRLRELTKDEYNEYMKEQAGERLAGIFASIYLSQLFGSK